MIMYPKSTQIAATTPYSGKTTHKSVREKERRDEINQKINELRELVCDDETERRTLKQADVLARTVDLVYRMESDSPGPSFLPERKGFVDGFSFAENEVYSFIKRLGVNPAVCSDFISRAKNCFEQERQSLLISQSAFPRNSPKTGVASKIRVSPSGENWRYSPTSFTSKMDRKEIKKNREQDRRDRQGEAIEALKSFLISISANKVSTRMQIEKMQRLNTLENIIDYIRNKRNNFVSRNSQDHTLYQHAFNGGFEIAKRTALEFFRNDRHLCVRSAAIEACLDLSRLTPFHPLIRPFAPFFITPVLANIPPSPSYSVDSPPPSSDTSLSSVDSATSTPKNVIWRPWQ